MKRPLSSLRVWLLGSWMRVFATIYIGGHLTILLALGIAAFGFPGQTIFRVEAVTDAFRLELQSGRDAIVWRGVAVAAARAGEQLPCTRADLAMPNGTVVTSDREPGGSLVWLVELPTQPATMTGLVLDCAGLASDKLPRRVLVFPGKGQLRPAIHPFQGRLVLGKDVPLDALPADVDILREGRLVVESHSRPFDAGVVRSERSLFAGEKVQVQRADSDAVWSGIVIVKADEARVIAAAAGDRALITRPGLPSAAPAAIAPTAWERLQVQPLYGLLALLLLVVLNVAGAVKDYIVAPVEARTPFAWTHTDDD